MIPYYLVDKNEPYSSAFSYVGYDWAHYVVSVGATISLATCLYSGMFPLPRVIYSIASDGLIYKSLAKIQPKFKTPAVATVVCGLIIGEILILKLKVDYGLSGNMCVG